MAIVVFIASFLVNIFDFLCLSRLNDKGINFVLRTSLLTNVVVIIWSIVVRKNQAKEKKKKEENELTLQEPE